MRLAVHVECMAEMRNAYRILVGTSEGKRPLGRPRRGFVVNIEMDLREIGWIGMDFIFIFIWLGIDVGQWRALVNLSCPYVIKCYSLVWYPPDSVSASLSSSFFLLFLLSLIFIFFLVLLFLLLSLLLVT
jgi:hypothetical protein